MPRKGRTCVDSSEFDLEVQNVFIGGKTTIEQRRDIALRWCNGRYDEVDGMALGLGLMPVALVVGCLLDVDHPLLVQDGRLTCGSLGGCAVLVLKFELMRVVHMPPVDNSGQVALVQSGDSVFSKRETMSTK